MGLNNHALWRIFLKVEKIGHTVFIHKAWLNCIGRKTGLFGGDSKCWHRRLLLLCGVYDGVCSWCLKKNALKSALFPCGHHGFWKPGGLTISKKEKLKAQLKLVTRLNSHIFILSVFFRGNIKRQCVRQTNPSSGMEFKISVVQQWCSLCALSMSRYVPL